MAINGCTPRMGIRARVLVVVLAVATGVTVIACGGTGAPVTSSPALPTGTGTQTAAAKPVHLSGGDSVQATQRVVDAFATGCTTLSGARFATLYASDVVYDDYAFGLHLEGKADVLKELRRSLGEADGVRVLAGFADHGWGVLEHRWDFTTHYQATIQPITVFEIRGGKIVNETWYYQDPAGLPNGTPLDPKPLKSTPRPGDTSAAAQEVALKYAAALQTKNAAAAADLSAARVAFVDTSSSTTGHTPEQVRAHYAKIFAPQHGGVSFTDPRYVFGRGWAAVLWTAVADHGTRGKGVTMLEIRDGKIVRETLYYDSSSVPFSVAPDN